MSARAHAIMVAHKKHYSAVKGVSSITMVKSPYAAIEAHAVSSVCLHKRQVFDLVTFIGRPEHAHGACARTPPFLLPLSPDSPADKNNDDTKNNDKTLYV